jgi:predicted ABC-type ATPase
VASLTIFAGPNGSGKSSIIGGVPYAGGDHLLEADAIALRIYPDRPKLAAIAAAREVLRRTQEYLSSGEDFPIETTLSGNWTRLAVMHALARGFVVRLVYCVPPKS